MFLKRRASCDQFSSQRTSRRLRDRIEGDLQRNLKTLPNIALTITPTPTKMNVHTAMKQSHSHLRFSLINWSMTSFAFRGAAIRFGMVTNSTLSASANRSKSPFLFYRTCSPSYSLFQYRQSSLEKLPPLCGFNGWPPLKSCMVTATFRRSFK